MGFLNTYNVVTKFAAFPCAEPSPLIIFGTFAPAVAPALIEWASFGCRDIMKFRLGKGVPCGRAMKAQVAKAIPPAWKSTVGNLLAFEHRFSQAGQMFLLADLASDTLARWTTLAYQLSDCPDANNIHSWQLEFSFPEALRPGIATPIGGDIVNETGSGGAATPTGAIVPAGWYFQCTYSVTAQTFHHGEATDLSTWIGTSHPGGFDFDAHHYPTGSPNQGITGHYLLTTQNTRSVMTQYQIYAMVADQLSITTAFSASINISEFPPTDWALNPLSCIMGGFPENVENPAGRNKKSHRPGMLEKAIGAFLPPPTRGPPGGKPRSKK